MTALGMQLVLRKLMARHNVIPEPHIVPLLEPVDHDMILSGFASTDDLDLMQQKFRKWAFTLGRFEPLPPLLFRHGEPAGEILELHNDDSGRLVIRARVTHPLAKRCSHFSVGATVQKWELRDADDPAKFHGLITQATIDEVSLTD